MRYVVWLLIAFCALLLQGRVSVLGVVPNLTVLLAFYAGIRYGANRGLLAGLLIGFVEDSLSHTLIGPNMLAKGLVGYTAAFYRRRPLPLDSPARDRLGSRSYPCGQFCHHNIEDPLRQNAWQFCLDRFHFGYAGPAECACRGFYGA